MSCNPKTRAWSHDHALFCFSLGIDQGVRGLIDGSPEGAIDDNVCRSCLHGVVTLATRETCPAAEQSDGRCIHSVQARRES